MALLAERDQQMKKALIGPGATHAQRLMMEMIGATQSGRDPSSSELEVLMAPEGPSLQHRRTSQGTSRGDKTQRESPSPEMALLIALISAFACGSSLGMLSDQHMIPLPEDIWGKGSRKNMNEGPRDVSYDPLRDWLSLLWSHVRERKKSVHVGAPLRRKVDVRLRKKR